MASVQVADKANSADPVTECDLASEEAIIREIRARFPDDEILSEEMPDSHDKLDDPDWSGWVLDPLDGTYNFSRRIPYFSSSVAWVKHGELALGGIADPNRGQVYTASRGGGTWLDGKRLAVSAKSDFGPGTRVATSNIVAGEGTQTNLDRFRVLGDVWYDVQGSTVMQMADLAAGRTDLLCHSGLKPWDSAAGLIMIREAGGEVLDLRGNPADWRGREILAGNPRLVERFLELSAQE